MLENITLNRREWLGCSLSSLAVLSKPLQGMAGLSSPRRLLTVLLTGGASHIDTFDPKPNAPSEIRGPFRAIKTSVPGVQISEHFPRLAQLANTFSLVRSMSAPGPQIHDLSGYGELLADTFELFPGPASPRFPLRPGLEQQGSFSVQDALRYGKSPLGQNLLLARKLLESGVERMTVHHFAGLLNTLSWDMHADGGDLKTTLDDYARILCPQLDQSLSALLMDLQQSGLLQETTVAVVSDMGRTPRLNARGGRDHHKEVWTNLVAGAGIEGGTVLGGSDRHGFEPVGGSISPAEFSRRILTGALSA
ncbi:MAG: DUF1501 domain-containing protein [Planctomycetales bacterium]